MLKILAAILVAAGSVSVVGMGSKVETKKTTEGVQATSSPSGQSGPSQGSG